MAGFLGASTAWSTVIDFTGGVVTLRDGSTQTTSNSVAWNGVAHYIEDGFKLEFVFATPPPGAPLPGYPGFPLNHTSYIGNYYNQLNQPPVQNDVIHGHWINGFGSPTDLTAIKITKVGGGTFDLNYFVLTSNSFYSDRPATGTEETWIKADNGYAQLLPSETWGFPGTGMYLGYQFDAVTSVSFFTTNAVECFGMDMFYINQAAPGVPDSSSTLVLMGLGLGVLGWTRSRCRRRR